MADPRRTGLAVVDPESGLAVDERRHFTGVDVWERLLPRLPEPPSGLPQRGGTSSTGTRSVAATARSRRVATGDRSALFSEPALTGRGSRRGATSGASRRAVKNGARRLVRPRHLGELASSTGPPGKVAITTAAPPSASCRPAATCRSTPMTTRHQAGAPVAVHRPDCCHASADGRLATACATRDDRLRRGGRAPATARRPAAPNDQVALEKGDPATSGSTSRTHRGRKGRGLRPKPRVERCGGETTAPAGADRASRAGSRPSGRQLSVIGPTPVSTTTAAGAGESAGRRSRLDTATRRGGGEDSARNEQIEEAQIRGPRRPRQSPRPCQQNLPRPILLSVEQAPLGSAGAVRRSGRRADPRPAERKTSRAGRPFVPTHRRSHGRHGTPGAPPPCQVGSRTAARERRRPRAFEALRGQNLHTPFTAAGKPAASIAVSL